MDISPFEAFDGAICAYVAAKRDEFKAFPFENAIIDISTTNPIDEFAASSAINSVAKQCRRLYSLVKHGTPTHRLNKVEIREARPKITRHNARHIRFDFRDLLSRMWASADRCTEPSFQTELFEKTFGLFLARTTRLKQRDTLNFFKSIVAALAVSVIAISIAPVAKEFGLAWQKEEHSHQLTMAILDKIQVPGGTTEVQKTARRQIAADTERQLMKVANIISELGSEDPVVTFVGTQVEKFRPALFEIIASSGGGLINGVAFAPDSAAKMQKQAKRNARKGIGMWSTTITS